MSIAPDWPTLGALALIVFADSIVYGVTGFGSALVIKAKGCSLK